MIYGYSKGKINKHGLLDLREVSLVMPPTLLRRVAKAILAVADEMESARELSPGWHRHLESLDSSLKSELENKSIVVCRPEDYREEAVVVYKSE